VSGRTPTDALLSRRPHSAVTSRCRRLAAVAVALMIAPTTAARAQDIGPANNHITIAADFGSITNTRKGGDSTQIVLLRRHVTIRQANTVITAGQGIAWIKQARPPETGIHVSVYLEDKVRLENLQHTLSRHVLLHKLTVSASTPTLRITRPQKTPGSLAEDPLYRRATAHRQRRPGPSHQLAAYQPAPAPAPAPALAPSTAPTPLNSLPTQRLRRVQLFPRTNRPFSVTTDTSPRTTPSEKVFVITGGINLVIDQVDSRKTGSLFGSGTVDLSADRAVIWAQMNDDQEISSQLLQAVNRGIQIYLEGNIELRQGGHVVRARRALYDARERRALMIDADLLAKIPGGLAPLRIRAEKIRQEGDHNFHAQNAWASTSRFGVPGYRLQASDVFLDRRHPPSWLGSPTQPNQDNSVDWITSQNNLLLLGDTPVFFAPNLGGPATEINFPLKRINLKQDNVFGFQAETTWSLFTLLGIEPAEGVDWTLQADYYTDRGPRIGSGLTYQQQDGLLGLPGDVSGWSNAAYLNDRGFDNLGRDRRRLALDSTHRGRGRLIHRHELPGNYTIQAEIGFLSDRNLLEQYYEQEFDSEKDHDTLMYLEQRGDNTAWSLLAQPRINDFETTTEWLPRADLFIFSQPLALGFDNRIAGWPQLSWSSHTSAGYARLRPADAPLDPADTFDPLANSADVGGAVLMSRHELSLPLMLGPAPVIPYVLAESAYWSEGMAGTEIDRHLFSGGLRSSLSMSRIDRGIQSPLLGLNGLAHKMTFESDFAWTETTRGLGEIPQYNPIDDNAQERFRYRLLSNSFAGTLPIGFDTRSFAVRNGVGLGLTSPWHELVADQQTLKMAWRHRLQTKTGAPGREQIRNWMTLDLQATWFPRADRDNFGEDFGLLAAAYRWHVSDRTTLLADAYLDLFDEAPQMWNLGLLNQRSDRGTLFANLRSIQGGGLDSEILAAGFHYRMSPKWVSTVQTAYDLAEHRNQGQSMMLTRIGGDFLVHFGASYDNSRGTTGFHLSLEPRFGATAEGNSANPQMNRLLGLGY